MGFFYFFDFSNTGIFFIKHEIDGLYLAFGVDNFGFEDADLVVVLEDGVEVVDEFVFFVELGLELGEVFFVVLGGLFLLFVEGIFF